jgi:hypothetical protein
VDAAPIVDGATGRILDFINVPAPLRRGVWPRGAERLAEDPWAAALVANHAVHVYRRYRDDPEWQPFFAELEATRARHLERAGGLTRDELLADYFFLRMGDLLSLTFCNAWSEAPEEFGFAIRWSAQRLTVTPDPFGGEEIQIEVPARELPDRMFASTGEAAGPL